MASDLALPGDDEGSKKPKGSAPPQKSKESTGFFRIYKSGQGYWTRMGTVGAALLIVALFVNFLYRNMPVWLGSAGVAQSRTKTVTIYCIAGFLVLYGLMVFLIMNRPTNADFLIATDSEMKKVNWTSKSELWGSTKIVILFMFLIAAMLFSFDIIFGFFFYAIKVLETPPFDPKSIWDALHMRTVWGIFIVLALAAWYGFRQATAKR